ncbi:N-acetyl-gamma-glutamyl-phosphate reductase [Alteromonas oceanisediminis]|uniref:N-acetyl-gamma-glutamyl-phosphate reductase n=1 Tax=Alteromonas oceanisediminis TaxID=2836180 RepID=UPI001BDAD153|nr:N-acetyl-gamma-glutamyl-phosphate reductase [Alteromonas oceanisediminis]MBT0586079.1 N-acetyl-gamma-glutamyl-phosphate reductase [Alteromonas oceanisediminis]
MKVCIIGASGYTGAELARLVHNHPRLSLDAVMVSARSGDAGKPLSDVHGYLNNQIHLPLQALDESTLHTLASSYDCIFLATPHEASHDWASSLLQGSAKVFDLSGAFRLQDKHVFAQHYGFEHQHPDTLSEAVYGLAEWYADEIANAQIVAVPGCYPTASLLATKPLMQAELLDPSHFPIINAVSGVSGAGRKAALNNSFCEVSLQAYGILAHRHTPEIAAYLGAPVIFTPHLGNFKRGILATITCKLKYGLKLSDVEDAFNTAYAHQPLVRMRSSPAKIDDVVGQPFCDLHWQYDPSTGYLIVTSAIDNLLKGAASQAIQCANLACGWSMTEGLTRNAV